MKTMLEEAAFSTRRARCGTGVAGSVQLLFHKKYFNNYTEKTVYAINCTRRFSLTIYTESDT